jgi:hypothetical protein
MPALAGSVMPFERAVEAREGKMAHQVVTDGARAGRAALRPQGSPQPPHQ